MSHSFLLADCGGCGTGGGAAVKAVAAAEKSKKVPTQKSPNIILVEEGTDPSIITKGMFSMYTSLSGRLVFDIATIRVSEISVYYLNCLSVPTLCKHLCTLHFAKA